MEKITTIAEAFKIKSGKQLSQKNYKHGNCAVYGGNGINGYHNEYTYEEPKIIIGRVGAYCGNIHRTQPKSWITDNALIIERAFVDYDEGYLIYLLNYLKLNRWASQSGQPLISFGRIKDIQIPLPPLPIQRRIAAILDQADALRRKDAELLARYDALAQSVFLELFGDPSTNPKGWKKQPFDFFAKFDTQMTKDFEAHGDFYHIGIGNIEKDTGNLVNLKKVKDENLTSGKYIFGPDHIIYSKIRPNLNKVALPNFNGLSSADSYPILVKKENATKMFFASLLRSKAFIDFILEHSSRTNIPKANKSQIRKFIGIAPPIELQEKYDVIMNNIKKQKQIVIKQQKQSEALFQSLLQKAFNGDLVSEEAINEIS